MKQKISPEKALLKMEQAMAPILRELSADLAESESAERSYWFAKGLAIMEAELLRLWHSASPGADSEAHKSSQILGVRLSQTP